MFFELLNDPAYKHMLLNHVPVVGLAVAMIVLAAGLVLRNNVVARLGLLLVAVTTGMAFPVAQFGDAAYPEMFGQLNGAGRDWLDYHVLLADRWLLLIYATSAVSILAFVWSFVARAPVLAMSCIGLLFALGAFSSAVGIAMAGGKISHPEFQLAAPPSQARN